MAPTFRPGKGTSVFVGSEDMTGVLNDSSFDASAGTADVTTYGHDDVIVIPALRDGTVTLSGLADVETASVVSVSEAVAGLAGSTGVVPISYFPDGGNVLGRAARLLGGVLTGANVASPVAGAVTAQTSFQGSGGPRHGWSLRTPAARTSTGIGTGVDTTTGAGVEARRALGGVAHLHVTAASASTAVSATIKVQHSDDDSSYSDLITFAAVTSTGYQRLTTASTCKQYVRETCSALTGSTDGSVTYTVAFASPA